MADKVRVSPQSGSQNWQQNFSSSGAKYTAGVKAVTTAPGQKAAAALPKWVASVTNPDVQKRFQTKVAAVSLSDWQNAASTTGASRLSTGATKGAPKYSDFAQKFYPYLDSGLAKVQSMPSITLDDRINRAVEMMRHNSQFKG